MMSLASSTTLSNLEHQASVRTMMEGISYVITRQKTRLEHISLAHMIQQLKHLEVQSASLA